MAENGIDGKPTTTIVTGACRSIGTSVQSRCQFAAYRKVRIQAGETVASGAARHRRGFDCRRRDPCRDELVRLYRCCR